MNVALAKLPFSNLFALSTSFSPFSRTKRGKVRRGVRNDEEANGIQVGNGLALRALAGKIRISGQGN